MRKQSLSFNSIVVLVLLCICVIRPRAVFSAAIPRTPNGARAQIASSPGMKPAYEVLRAAGPIRVDGNLEEPAWSAAPTLGPFVNNADGSKSPIATEAKVLYDDKFIYFAFRNSDDNISATMTKRDASLWEEEVNEVFIQADLQQTSYIELEVNPLGAIFDAFLLDIRKPLHYESWNSEKLQAAVQVEGTVDGKPGDKGWTCEIALPLEDVVPAPHTPPIPGDRWRVNLYRIERVPFAIELAAFPTRKDFHVPSMFGEIVFSGRTAGARPAHS